MKKWGKRGFIFIVSVLALMGLARFFEKAPFGKALGVLEVEGAFWVADDWLKQIDDFRKDPHIAGVLVRIHSPGGTVAAAQEIYESLKRLREVKPVVVSMGTIAASGGLYIAMASDTIVAEAGTITGSIGVRMEHLNLEELLKFAKVKYETIKSGRMKDLASISRSLTPEEKGLLEDVMLEIHEQFKKVVVESRKLKPESVAHFADGRIFTGAKAKELGLVDTIGDMGEAVKIAASKAGIVGEPRLVYGSKPGVWWLKAFLGMAKAYLSGPLICYLY